MIGNLLGMFPASWKVDVDVLVSNGRDDNGDPVPPTVVRVNGCLLAPRTTNDDPHDFSDFVTDRATLYAPLSATFKSTDRVRTPAHAPIEGTWAVDGSPVRWPFGWAVPLRRE